MVTEHLLNLLFLKFGNVFNRHLELGILRHFCLVKVDKSLLVSFYFFSLILHPFLQFNCVFFHHGCLSLSKLTFRFIFAGFKRFILIKILKFFVFNLILELLNSHSFLLADVFCLISSIFVHLFDFSLKVLDFWLDLVSVRLLDKDNLAVLNLRQVLVFLLAVLLSDWKHTDWTICGTTEKCLVVIRDTHLLYR